VTSKTKRIWKNETLQTIIAVIITAIIVFGVGVGSQIILNTKISPALAVVSGSMCIPYDGACDGWTHPFNRTLHIGDLIIIQGVNPKTLKTNYPESDIIVFQRPDLPRNDPDSKIVHRIAYTVEYNGKLYFYTKGDGNPLYKWPNTPEPTDYWHPDSNNPNSTYNGGVSEDYVYGKLILRIPWIGWVPIKMQQAGISNNSLLISAIIIVLILLLIVQFIDPLLRRKNIKPAQTAIAKLLTRTSLLPPKPEKLVPIAIYD